MTPTAQAARDAGSAAASGSLIPTAPPEAAARPDDDAPAAARPGRVHARRRGDADGDAGPRDPVPRPALAVAAPTSPSSRSTQITPNRVQPRQVFDEEAMAELVHSIREIGLLQPVVVRRTGPRTLRAGHGRAPLARRPGGRPRRRSRRSCGRPTTTTCCATRCWRTCTAPSSTRSRRPRRTPSCSRTSAAPTRSSPSGSAAPARRSATRCGCSSSRPAVQRRVAAGVLSAGHARALLAVEDADLQDRLAAAGRRRGHQRARPRGDRRRRRPGQTGSAAAQRTPPSAPGLATSPTGSPTGFETRVKVDLGKGKGKITVEFASLDDLRRIVDIMDPRNRNDRPDLTRYRWPYRSAVYQPSATETLTGKPLLST